MSLFPSCFGKCPMKLVELPSFPAGSWADLSDEQNPICLVLRRRTLFGLHTDALKTKVSRVASCRYALQTIRDTCGTTAQQYLRSFLSPVQFAHLPTIDDDFANRPGILVPDHIDPSGQ